MERPGLVAFDMDGTLIRGRFILAVAQKYGLTDKILSMMHSTMPEYLKSQEIVKLLKNQRASDLFDLINDMPLTAGTRETISELRRRGYKTGIISDSYTLATDCISQKLGMDFSVANRLEVSHGVLTGRIVMPLGWVKDNCTCRRSVCKGFHFERMAKKFRIPLSSCVAVGDREPDICMLKKARIGIAFNPKSPSIFNEALFFITKPDLREILRYIP